MAQIAQLENRWKITGDIEIANASALLQASKALTMSDNAIVDFEDVIEIDTAAISLILEWKRRAIAEKKQLQCVNLPANLTSLTELYGVADLIH